MGGPNLEYIVIRRPEHIFSQRIIIYKKPLNLSFNLDPNFNLKFKGRNNNVNLDKDFSG